MGCNVQDVVTWYQRKIGTYDKQQWEKTVEQRILSGFTNVPMKRAKLKTELIDVDLVRGSAFTKAKPKHGFLMVTKLAALRLFFMPFYYHWWICQTSSRIFIALIILYSLQLFNTCLYFTSCYLVDNSKILDSIPPNEVLVPFAMMLVLSIIHSQIVSTHSCNRQNKQELQNNSYVKRLKRTRRRHIIPSKIRPLNPDSKEFSESNLESSNDHSKFSQRMRIKNSTSTQKIEEQVQQRSLGDDGFESLDGNGSCDSNKDEQDISLTAREYETALRKSLVPENLFENSLVVLKSSEIKENVEICHDSSIPTNNGFHFSNDNIIIKKQHAADDCLKITVTNNERTDYDFKNGHINLMGMKCINASETKNLKKLQLPDSSSGIKQSQTLHTEISNLQEKETDIDGSASEPVSETSHNSNKRLLTRRKGSRQNLSITINKKLGESSYNSTGDESEDGTTLSSPGSFSLLTEGTTSAGEWVGVTTNSEECSYSSELDGSDDQFTVTNDIGEHPFAWEMEMMPNVIFSPSCTQVGKVSCTIWENKEVKKANLSVLDISSAIIARVEAMPENVDYFYIGIFMSIVLALIPCACRLAESLYDNSNKTSNFNSTPVSNKYYVEPYCPLETYSATINFVLLLMRTALGSTPRDRIIVFIATLERFCSAAIFFFLLTVAERTFKQRFLYAKFFSHLTSSRRAKKSELPHFRLNKVRNIKSWLSVRSYLKKRGPQRSVDVIVSTSFLITVILLSFLSVELLKDSEYNVEAVGWCVIIGFYMLRFITLGTKINKKYRNLSTLITEQINLYLQIEQKPNKKEELMVANSVLKLAADLLKELECPFKISGFSANPYLYTVTKVVMLSALSGILSEFLGFKLKLHKIKIK